MMHHEEIGEVVGCGGARRKLSPVVQIVLPEHQMLDVVVVVVVVVVLALALGPHLARAVATELEQVHMVK